jgi:protein gp37
MGYPTPIEWTDSTWNPIGGCSIKSPGCIPCYAQQLAGTRLAHHPLYERTTTLQKGRPVFNGKLTAAPDGHPVWKWPLTWRGAQEPKLGRGQPSTIFVGDMSDLFHEDRPRAVIEKTVGTILRSKHIGQLLTKRADVMAAYFEGLPGRRQSMDCDSLLDWGDPRSCLWLGASAERQPEFDERWPYLRRLAALGYTVFISYEPAIGPLTLPDDFLALGGRAQVIAGGMSGKNDPRPSHPDWFRAVRDQCEPAGVAFFFKQWGEYLPVGQTLPGYGKIHGATAVKPGRMKLHYGGTRKQTPKYAYADGGVDIASTTDCRLSFRVGKKAAGRLLDGREHNEFPRIGAAA